MSERWLDVIKSFQIQGFHRFQRFPSHVLRLLGGLVHRANEQWLQRPSEANVRDRQNRQNDHEPSNDTPREPLRTSGTLEPIPRIPSRARPIRLAARAAGTTSSAGGRPATAP